MAKINMWHGSIKGRIGELVGSTWKGVRYIKTFTPPTNPRTLVQQETRYTFAFLGEMASALALPVLNGNMYPHPRKMSRMNATLKANSHFVRQREVRLPELQLFPPTMETDILWGMHIIQESSVPTGILIEIRIELLNDFKRRPDNIALAFYNFEFDLWYGVGVFPITGTANNMLLSVILPDQVLVSIYDCIFYIAPIWHPNPAVGLAGGNGITASYWEATPPLWKPDPKLTPKARLAAAKARQAHAASSLRQIDITERERIIAEKRAEAATKDNHYFAVVERGLEQEITRLAQRQARVEKREAKAKAQKADKSKSTEQEQTDLEN